MLQEVKPPRMSSSRKNLFIVRSAPLLQIQGSAVGPLFEVKINEVLHCGTSLGVTHIFHCSKPRKWSRHGRFEKQIFYPTKDGCQRLTSIPPVAVF